MPKTKTRARRRLELMGYALIANGALGLLLALVALVTIGPLVARTSGAVDSAGDSLAAAALSLDQTAAAFDGFSVSLNDAKVSSAHASQLLNDAAGTSTQLADGMAISFFGSQPFLSLSQSFRKNADELKGVSADLSTLSGAIGKNAADVATVRDSVRVLRDRVQELARAAAASPTDRRVGPELTILAYGLALWLAVLGALSLAGGYLLLRQ